MTTPSGVSKICGVLEYWAFFQIIGPHDTEIIRIAEEEGKPKDEYWDLNGLASNPMLFSADVTIDPYFEIERSLIYHKWVPSMFPPNSSVIRHRVVFLQPSSHIIPFVHLVVGPARIGCPMYYNPNTA